MNFLTSLQKKIIGILCLLWFPTAAFSLHQPLQVGVMDYPPFNIIIPGGAPTGLAVDLWEAVAALNHWDYQYVIIPPSISVDKMLGEVQDGTLDILIAPVVVTHQRLQVMDFSRSFFLEHTAITVPESHDYLIVFKEFLSKALLYIAAISIFCYVLYLHLFWFFEHKKNNAIPKGYRAGISELLWKHLFNGRKIIEFPKTVYGRIVSLIWVVLTLVVFSSYNASVTSALTLALTSTKTNISMDTLKTMHVAGLNGAVASKLAKRHGISIQLTKSIEEAFNLLENNKVEGVLSSDIIAKYYLQKHPSKKKYLVLPLENQSTEAAFATPLYSLLIRPINLALTDLQDKKETNAICLRYLTSTDAARCGF